MEKIKIANEKGAALTVRTLYPSLVVPSHLDLAKQSFAASLSALRHGTSPKEETHARWCREWALRSISASPQSST